MDSRSRVEGLLAALGQAYDEPSWHGSNLKGSIRGVEPDVASWRPDPGRHNIWEIVVHAAYWKYAARRRLTREKRGLFPLKGNDWFERSGQLSLKAWRSDLELLEDQHRRLLEAVAGFADGRLKNEVGKGLPGEKLIRGVAFHDVYHAGQIRLLRRLRSV